MKSLYSVLSKQMGGGVTKQLNEALPSKQKYEYALSVIDWFANSIYDTKWDECPYQLRADIYNRLKPIGIINDSEAERIGYELKEKFIEYHNILTSLDKIIKTRGVSNNLFDDILNPLNSSIKQMYKMVETMDDASAGYRSIEDSFIKLMNSTKSLNWKSNNLVYTIIGGRKNTYMHINTKSADLANAFYNTISNANNKLNLLKNVKIMNNTVVTLYF